MSFGAGFQRQGQRLMRHTRFLLDDWKPKTNWRARESHRIRSDHPRRFVGIRLEIPGRSLTNRTWNFTECSANHDFSASSEADNTRCKSGSRVSLPLLSSILSRMLPTINRDIYFSMRRHFAKQVPYKDKSNYFHCIVSCTFTFTSHICENKVNMFWSRFGMVVSAY